MIFSDIHVRFVKKSYAMYGKSHYFLNPVYREILEILKNDEEKELKAINSVVKLLSKQLVIKIKYYLNYSHAPIFITNLIQDSTTVFQILTPIIVQ